MEPATILVVDDELDVRETLRDYLGTLGYRIVTAASAAAALEILAAHAADLILTDVHMGGMNGVELCRRLKTDPRFQLTPVIILTARSDLESRVAGLAAGADDFFAKPAEFVELRTRVASLLRIKKLQDDLAAKNQLLRALLGRYVSEEVATEIVANPERHLKLGGDKREVTMLFGDLRGFTPLAESLDAHDVVEILNTYLTQVVDAVFAGGGVLDKFRGDGFMAIFGAPLGRPDDAARAVHCALCMQEQISQLRFAQFGDFRLHMGIGINTGRVIAGNVGSERRMDYTVIGDEVNLAQRLEANAGPGQILIGESTYAHVQGAVQVRELGPLRVKGRKEGVRVYDVIGVVPGAMWEAGIRCSAAVAVHKEPGHGDDSGRRP
jgi:adenylate cyclase